MENPVLDEVHPGRRGRGEVQVNRGVRCEPGADHGVLVGGVVVHHQVQTHTGVGAGELAQEPQVAVPGQAVLGHLPGGDLQGGEPGGGAVAAVVVGCRSGMPGCIWSIARFGPTPGSATARLIGPSQGRGRPIRSRRR